MKIRIVLAYVPRYRRGHRFDFVPPVTGIHLAALTGAEHDVEVIHEQVQDVPIDDTVDLVAISFFAGFADRAYAIADAYRRLGVPVVMGGPHASYWQTEALKHADSVVIGEAEAVWQEMLQDAQEGRLKKRYQGQPADLRELPMLRYDLLESRFLVPRVLQATRGCPYTCTFCTVPDLNPGFRVRPIEDVVRDISESHFPHFWQERVAWFWDDNLLVNRKWAKDLLREMRGLNRWWLTQASIDIVKDRELLDLMEQSGCIGIFLGIESLDEAGIESVGKRQNRVRAYRDAVDRLHDRGICVMAGMISGFDNQDEDSVLSTADRLQELHFDVPFLSILTPFRGTVLYDELNREGRLLRERDWGHYNGYNVAFKPAKMSPEALLRSHRRMWKQAFSPRFVAERLMRGARQLSPGGVMLSSAMNGFYGFKSLTDNLPADAALEGASTIEHPDPRLPGHRLHPLRRGLSA